jgi:hypothetical protein
VTMPCVYWVDRSVIFRFPVNPQLSIPFPLNIFTTTIAGSLLVREGPVSSLRQTLYPPLYKSPVTTSFHINTSRPRSLKIIACIPRKSSQSSKRAGELDISKKRINNRHVWNPIGNRFRVILQLPAALRIHDKRLDHDMGRVHVCV